MLRNSTSEALQNVNPDKELTYIAATLRQELARRESDQVLKGIKKRAKAIGVNYKAADFVEAQAKRGEKGVSHLFDIIRIALTTGFIQDAQIRQILDSNARASEQALQDHLLAKALVSGWEDGYGGIPSEDNPYPADSEQAAKWAEGSSRGTAAHQLELGLEGQVASTRREMPKARRERKSVSVVSDQANGHGSVLPQAKRRGRPPGAKNKPKPPIVVVEEPTAQYA